MEKLFIFDVDGVLLNLWTPMKKVYEAYTGSALSGEDWQGIIQAFIQNPAPFGDFAVFYDNSPTFGNLPEIRGMKDFVYELKQNGFDLKIVTAIAREQKLVDKRAENLRRVYGDIFDDILCVGRCQSKAEALRQAAQGYAETFFCDDSPKNLTAGRGVIQNLIWFENEPSRFVWESMDTSDMRKARNADELRKIIVEPKNKNL